MSSLYTRIVIIESSMHLTVDLMRVINIQVLPRIPAYPLSH